MPALSPPAVTPTIVLRANQVWLYAAIVTIGYMISRGLAKAGSRDPYTDAR